MVVDALMVQSRSSLDANGRLTFAEFAIDPGARCLWRAGELVHVQPKVMELLLHLLQHRERFVSKQELHSALWTDVIVGSASLPRLVKELRRVLGDPAEEPRLVRTLHGRGYQFIGKVAGAAAHPLRDAVVQNQTVSSPFDATRSGSDTGGVDGCQRLQLRTLYPEGHAPLALTSAATMRIGRDPRCGLVLPYDGVSRQHAELELVGHACTLRDLGSRNGVFVNGEKLSRPMVLRCGQLVRIDGWLGILEQAPAVDRSSWPRHPALQIGPRLGALLEPLVHTDATAPLLIDGESGTGKSLLAHVIHDWSRRRGRLLELNGGALPADARGWGQALSRAFEAARGGTLLIEAVDTLSLAQQDGLHALCTTFEADADAFGVRIVATVRNALRARTLAGAFHAELYARLSAHTLTLTPLRDRRQDIPGLFQHALVTHSGGRAPALSPRLVEALCLYDWPFNVRELQFVARSILHSASGEARLSRRHLPPRLAGQAPASQHESRIRTARTPSCSNLT